MFSLLKYLDASKEWSERNKSRGNQVYRFKKPPRRPFMGPRTDECAFGLHFGVLSSQRPSPGRRSAMFALRCLFW